MNKPLRPIMPPEAAYRSDSGYRHLVDSLEAILHRAILSPAEVREASMLACIHFEERNLRYLLSKDGRTVQEGISSVRDRLDELQRWLDMHRRPGDG